MLCSSPRWRCQPSLTTGATSRNSGELPRRGTDLGSGVRNAGTSWLVHPLRGSRCRDLEGILKLITTLLVVTAASTAWAQSPTKVFPLTGRRLPRQYTKAPEVLARAIAKSAGG